MMKKYLALLAAGALTLGSSAFAQVATDPSGDRPAFATILDLTNLYVSESAGTVTIAVDTVGNIITTDWGNYMFYIETDNAAAPVGGAGAGNGWGRPINPDGANLTPKYWVGSWVNAGGGVQLWELTAAPNTWTQIATGAPMTITPTATNISITIPRTLLGSPNTIQVVAMSSGGGGGDTAVDSVPSITDPVNWGDAVVQNNPSSSVTVPVELSGFSIE